MRLIDADKLLEKKTVPLGLKCEVVSVNDIMNAPTINPERPKGEWEEWYPLEWLKKQNTVDSVCPHCGKDVGKGENR